MHPSEEQIQRLLHGELPAAAEKSAREHVAGCADCRRLLAEAEREEREVYALLRSVDDPPPPADPEAIALRAELATATARAEGVAWLRRAAAILLAVGIAGAAYALPGSPVRGWVHAIVEKVSGRPAPSTVAPVPGGSPSIGAGISVLPDERLVILFKAAPGDGQIFVSLVDEPEVQVHGPTGAATFTSGAGQLLVDVIDPTVTFEIRIPRNAPWIEIQAGGGRVFLKEGTRVTTSKSKDVTGGYLIRLTP